VDRVRAELFATSRSDTLVVAHAGIMTYLRRALLGMGFRGPSFRLARHGYAYVFVAERS
jgi:hypothetical protein